MDHLIAFYSLIALAGLYSLTAALEGVQPPNPRKDSCHHARTHSRTVRTSPHRGIENPHHQDQQKL